MRKSLIAALLTVSLGGAAAAAAVAGAAAPQQPPAPRNPVLLAEAAPRAPANAARTRRPAPDDAARRSDFCDEAYARAAGRFAYLEARLALTGAQAAAFDRWRDLRLAAAKRRAGKCAARPLPGRGVRGASPVERLTREESLLQRRLADIQAERPALEALYNSLNAGQRQVLAREDGFGGFGRGGFRPPAFRRLAFGRGPGADGPRGAMFFRSAPAGAPDAPPPPPPAQ